ncbi:hypothetical protein CYMTET_33863, partial [Cymbomonas tetramitiformis]
MSFHEPQGFRFQGWSTLCSSAPKPKRRPKIPPTSKPAPGFHDPEGLFSGSLPIPAPGLRLSLVLLALAAAVLCCVDIAGEVAQRAAEEEEWAQSLIGFTVPWYQHHSWGRGGTDGADSEEETLQLNMEDGIADAELLSYAQELGLSEEQVQEQLHPSNELAQ